VADDPEATKDPGHAEGAALADALRNDGSAGLETRRARAAAKAGLFGKPIEGTKVDRYFVIALMGSGAMGSVYAAYDPKLDRKVALKVLLPEAIPDADDPTRESGGARETLVREAQALAQVRHPNVVHVYDAGTFADQVYLTMELVEGETLRAWLERDEARGWESTLRMLMQAGRGLAAVHGAGLVHRDFKPDNVLVGKDGVARVADFGLARADQAEDVAGLLATAAEGRGSKKTLGAGTPAYLAPERMKGTPADARSDVFSFCVAVFEALAGARPFPDVAILTGELTAASRGKLPTGLPSWLVRAVERGLDPDPSGRPKSMDALLGEFEAGLEADVISTQRGASAKRLGVGLTVAAAIVAGIYGAKELDRSARVSKCDAAAAEIEEMWPGRSDVVAAGIRSSELSYADATVEKLMPLLDAWADDWREAQRQVCVDATVEQALPAALLPRSEGCLEVRRAKVGGLLDLFESGDQQAVQQAVASVSALASVSGCADRAQLEQGAWPDKEQWDRVLEAQKKLSVASSLESAGKYPEGLERAQEVLEEAESLKWTPLVAAARYRVGSLQAESGHYEDGVELITAAFFEARRGGAEDVAAAAATSLVGLVGDRLAQADIGLTWARHAEAQLDTIQAGPRERAKLMHGRAAVLDRQGKYAEAKQSYEEAIALQEQFLGPEHPGIASALNNLANAVQSMGDVEAARVLHERSLEIRERALGPGHPDVASSLNNIGIDYIRTGSYADARQPLERALGIFEAALGPNHPRVSNTLNSLGMVEEYAGQTDRARAHYERALRITEQALGAEHPDLMVSLSNLGELHRSGGDHETAKSLFLRALAIAENAHGPDHPAVAKALGNVGMVHEAAGEFDQAIEHYQRALPLMEKALGASHPVLAANYCNLGNVMGKAARPRDAVGAFESCAAVFDSRGGVQPGQAAAHFYLAKAIVAAKGDRQRALGLARQAIEELEAGADPMLENAQPVEAWIAEQAG
jgi:tetratricopeptide (TPR) repeat protein